MNSNPDVKKKDPFAGFLASVAVALLASNFLARHLVDLISYQFTLTAPDIWKTDIAAGLFVGIVLADPVGNLLHHKTIPRFLIKFAVGFLFGLLIQRFVVMPMAGGDMSRYVFLILAVLLLPIIFCIETYKDFLRSRNLAPGEAIVSYFLRIMSLPDRAIIVLTMAASFVAFWAFGKEIQHVLIVLAAVLASTTLIVAFSRSQVPEEEESLWFTDEADEHEISSVGQMALSRLKVLSGSLLPGAILLGGVMRMALDMLLGLYPNIAASMADPIDAARTFGIVAASGFGMVLLGMFLALGFGMLVLLLIARIKKWPADEIKQRSIQLGKVLFFRNLKGHS